MDEFLRRLIRMAINQSKLIKDEQEALDVKELYPQWSSRIGKEVQVGEFYRYKDKLYKCLQTHTIQEGWEPDVVESLWTVIDEEHVGTLEDSIPFVVNMEVFEGKYYMHEGVLYLCIRDSGTALYHTPGALLGIYFKVVEQNE